MKLCFILYVIIVSIRTSNNQLHPNAIFRAPFITVDSSGSAQRLELASVYKGEADKILQVKKAEAKYLGGVGVARQRQAITDGLRENMLNFSHTVEGASSKDVIDLIMITQYFDTIKDLVNSSKNTTVFISHGPGHVRDISDQIRNGLMEGKAGVHAD